MLATLPEITVAVTDMVTSAWSGPLADAEREAVVVIPATIDKLWSSKEPRTAVLATSAVSDTVASVSIGA